MIRENVSQENKIRELAYQIWESEGKPHGRAKTHWELACELAESEVDGYIPPVTRVNPLDAIEQQEPEVAPVKKRVRKTKESLKN
ncbi:MAG: DUF2934 domain-containing protein [Gammaproteobacteria bacterium]|nr:MAG: DUF2934 domain-containing protein [Gammaproteobacteria bacterium]